jgi:hypothetical protein
MVLSGEGLLEFRGEALVDVCHMHGTKRLKIPAHKTNTL